LASSISSKLTVIIVIVAHKNMYPLKVANPLEEHDNYGEREN